MPTPKGKWAVEVITTRGGQLVAHKGDSAPAITEVSTVVAQHQPPAGDDVGGLGSSVLVQGVQR